MQSFRCSLKVRSEYFSGVVVLKIIVIVGNNHMVLKLNKIQRWLPSKRYLLQQLGVSVHYSNIHHDYYSTWCYVTKSDKEYEESDGHSGLANVDRPKTTKGSIGKKNVRGKADVKTLTKEKKAKGVGKTGKKQKSHTGYKIFEYDRCLRASLRVGCKYGQQCSNILVK